MARDDPPFNLRMPADLRSQLETAAKANGRSVTAEINQRLARSFDAEALTGEPGYALDRAILVAFMHASPRARQALAALLDVFPPPTGPDKP